MMSEIVCTWKIVPIERVTKKMKLYFFQLFKNEKKMKDYSFVDFLSIIEKNNSVFYLFYFIEDDLPKAFFVYSENKFGKKILTFGYNGSPFIKEAVYSKIIEKFRNNDDNYYTEVSTGFFKDFLKRGILPINDNTILFELTEGKFPIYKKSSIIEITDNNNKKKLMYYFGNPKIEGTFIKKQFIRD